MEGDFRIGEWLVQPLRDVIESAGECIALEPKAMDLLVYLAENQGEVLPKERLIQAIWPDAFVTDEVLTNTIWKLRQAFGDEPKNPKIIQTIPRRGYQLIAEVVFEEAGDETSDRYEMQRQLGRGAMGEVHLAKDLLLGRQVALKFLPAQMEEDDSLCRRLFREARAAAALDQPYICKVYDTGQMDGRTFIAMEYVEGQTLKEKLKEGPIVVEEALRIAGEIAEALHAAHEKGIVHRDIKPSNIMLSEQGHVKVMDFGVAKKLPTEEGDQEWTATLTTDASSMGTLPYMSPEQVRGQAVDTRSDIFSFGVVLYEMLTGVHPFRKPLSADTAAATLNEEAPPLSKYRKKFSTGLQDLLTRMLAKDREDRYQSIEDVRSDLGRLDTDRSVIFPMEVLKRNGLKLALAAVGLVAVAAATVLMIWAPWGTTSVPPPSEPKPLTSNLGIELNPVLSRNGTFVAFEWDGNEPGNSDIYVQAYGDGEPTRRTSDPAEDRFPAWSPDGSQIAFVRKVSGTKYSVFVIPFLGGPSVGERWVADSTFSNMGSNSGGLSWSPDQDVIAMVHRSTPDDSNSIFLLSPETGEKRRLTSPPQGAWDGWPTFSPSGSSVAFCRNGTKDNFTHICIRDLQGGEAEPLWSTRRIVRGLDWTSDGSAIVVAHSEMATQNAYLSKIPVDGGEPQRLPFGEGADWVSIAREGGRLAYHIYQWSSDIWQLAGPEASEESSPTQFPASSTRVEGKLEYSPDGSKIAYSSFRSGVQEIWRCNADGTELDQLTNFGESLIGGWSPSSDEIVFAAPEMPGKVWDILVMDDTGGGLRNLTPDEYEDTCPSWSADGHWIYYSSNREGPQICRVPAAGGPTEQLTENGGYVPRVTKDGQVLFWRDSRIWRVSPNEGEETVVLDKKIDSIFTWCPWEDYIVYAGPKEEGQVIEMFSLSTGETSPHHTLGKEITLGHGFTVSPDGQWILYTPVEFNADLMLVEDFY